MRVQPGTCVEKPAAAGMLKSILVDEHVSQCILEVAIKVRNFFLITHTGLPYLGGGEPAAASRPQRGWQASFPQDLHAQFATARCCAVQAAQYRHGDQSLRRGMHFLFGTRMR